ncbi:MAG: hypothetical protein J7515_02865 [Caulobacter sp.]|nr:hypothetical protein [Caulobacter sp.]
MTDDIQSDTQGQHWDPVFAETLVGKTLLVGLTFLDGDGEVVSREEFWGVVISADEAEGITLDLMNEEGDTFTLPPQTSNISPAEPGDYTLKSTGETVPNPDFVSTWMIHGPPEPANDED